MLTAERVLTAAILAAGITFGLFWLMQRLLIVKDVALDPEPPISIVPFVHVHVVPRPIKTRTSRPELQPPDEIPAPVDSFVLPTEGGGTGFLPIEPMEPGEGRDAEEHGWGRAPADGDAVPLVRISPKYPARALARGIEGRVLIEFTIGRSGAVEDAHIIAAEPRFVFDRAALEAVQQWRYNPKIENGIAVEQPGIRIAIPFRNVKQSAK